MPRSASAKEACVLQCAVVCVGRQLGLGNPAGIAQRVLRCGLAGDQYLVPVALLPHHEDTVAEEGLRLGEIVRGERLLLGRRHIRQPAANIDRICQGGMVDRARALRRGPHRGHRNGDKGAGWRLTGSHHPDPGPSCRRAASSRGRRGCSRPTGCPESQPEKKITAATITTPATMPTEAATRLRPLVRCPCGDFGA